MNYQNILHLLKTHLIHGVPMDRNNILLYLTPFLTISLVLINKLWRYAAYVSTIVHESGHAIAAITVLSKLKGIRINSDHSGTTNYIATNFIPFKIWVCLWGYIFPSFLGVLYIYSSINGWSGYSATFTLFLGIIISFQVRNFIAFITIWSFTIIIGIMWVFLPVNIITLVFYGLGWFLLYSSLRNIWELSKVTYNKNSNSDSDITELRAMTLIPATVWLLLYYLLAISALIFSLTLLIK